MRRNNPPPKPPFDIRPLRSETKPHAVHVVRPAGSKVRRRCDEGRMATQR